MRKARSRAGRPQKETELDVIRERLLEELSELDFGQAKMASLAEHSTMGVGGPAVVLEVPDLGRLTGFLRLEAEKGWGLFMVGQGSNVLFPDCGLTAVVVRLVGDLAKVEPPEGSILRAGAGASVAKVLYAAESYGLSGFEFMAGIPGSLGGAAWGNAGAAGKDVSSVIRTLTIASAKNAIETLPISEFRPGYRRLGPPPGREGSVIVAAEMELEKSTKEAVRQSINERLKSRTRGQPRGRSLGCVFMNPPGDFAGRLLDQCGLKGKKLGGAVISEAHANFIVNQGGASARDVSMLAKEMADMVKKNFGIALEPEIRAVDEKGQALPLGDSPGPANQKEAPSSEGGANLGPKTSF
ncbi:MAG: UDP-N-acetylmuramate dehydrogenase [Deltaproteobacteria bacterium]|jgi:UDP-N-acetylmuramate dehydrogenase|nr:UDP-N-acetylmuramate dehydrogenase [Deltaproteobacteria bacterium]